MKFIIKKESLLVSLQKVLGPTTTKQNFPALNSVLISTDNNKLKFVSTDLSITVIVFLDAKISKPGKILVPMNRLLSIVREMPDKEITVETHKNSLLITCEKIEFKINILDTEEFPRIEEAKSTSFIKINPEDLLDMIRLTSFSVGFDDVSYVLNGILFEIVNDSISLVSTDAKRLSYIRRKLSSSQPAVKTIISFILPIKAVSELFKLIKDKSDEILLFAEKNKIGFDFKDTQFICRPIEGEFPDYKQYIPQESKEKLTVKRKDFLLALKRAALLSTPNYQGVKISISKGKSLDISKTTPQLGEVQETLDVQYNGAAVQIFFNPNYIMDVLKNLEDEEISFEFTDADKPAVLRKEDYIYLIVPMKI